MSVAVAQMPRTFAERQSIATTDFSEDLLDALLASCQKSSAKPFSGQGRDLVPYFPTSDHTISQPPKSGRRNFSPPRVNHKANAAAVAMIAAAKKSGQAKKNSGAPTPPARSAAQRVAEAQTTQFSALVASWAGPGFCVSPLPEKLPLPTSSLLG